jgi:hypothetical protein
VYTIDLKEPFDRISREYLFGTLKAHGFSEHFMNRLKRIYENATSTLHMNGYRSRNIRIDSSARQGCPLSMTIFTQCINPLIVALDKKLAGVRIGTTGTKTTVLAYADDITMLTKQEEIETVREILQDYVEASGAEINTHKSKALELGGWHKTRQVMGIQYCEETKILGFHMRHTKESSMRSWEVLTARIRATAQEAYLRDLSMDYRIRYVHDCLLARALYTTQIYPPPEKIVRQLNMTISWFIWQGVIFRVQLSTLQNPKEEGEWGLINPEAKCQALFLYRMREQG